MLPLYQIILLAIVQGLTEFLPISSSAHLILIPKLTGWQDQGVLMDVAVHMGTLGAVVMYFWSDVKELFWGGIKVLQGKITPSGHMLLKLALATVPTVLVGVLVSLWGQESLRKVEIIAWASLLLGIVLYFIDRWQPNRLTCAHITYGRSFLIGWAQAVAFIPGSSRAGMCLTALRGLGIERSEAGRYACLMSIPTIIAAGVLEASKLPHVQNMACCTEALIAVVCSFGAGLLMIRFMMTWVQTASFGIFVFYRVMLGLLLLGWVYLG